MVQGVRVLTHSSIRLEDAYVTPSHTHRCMAHEVQWTPVLR